MPNADIAKVKRNIGRMINGGASEAEIDSYLGAEGVTLDMLHAKPKDTPQQVPSNPVQQYVADMRHMEGVDGEAPDQNGEGLLRAVKNIPASAFRAGVGMSNALLHPINTATFLGKSAAGLAQKAAPGDALGTSYKPYADLVIQSYKDRYGSIPAFQRTLEEDPVGVGIDLAGFASGASAVARGISAASKAGGAATLAELAAGAGDVAGQMGRAVDPVRLAGMGVPSWVARKVYQSALKPSPAMTRTNRKAMLESALNNKIPISEAGLDKAESLSRPLSTQVDGLLAEAANRGVAVNPADVASSMDPLLESAQSTTNPSRRLPALQRTRDEFLENNSVGPYPVGIPVDKANQMKRQTYKWLKDEAFDGDMKSADVMGQKALSLGLKRAIEQAVPDVGPLNAQLGPLLELQEEMGRRLGTTGNRSLIGSPYFIAATGEHPAAGVAAQAVNSPYLWSKVAIGLNDLMNGEIPTPVGPNIGPVARGALQESSNAGNIIEEYDQDGNLVGFRRTPDIGILGQFK